MNYYKKISQCICVVLIVIFGAGNLAQAGDNSGFIGNWAGNTNNAAGRGAGVEVHVWETKKKQLAGVSYYGGPKCVGYLTQVKDTTPMIELREEIVSGSGCKQVETVSAMIFNSKYLMLQWKDAGNSAVLSSTLRKIAVSEPMQKVIALYRDGKQQAQQKLQQQAVAQVSQQTNINALVHEVLHGKASYQDYFVESALIGAWRGTVYDNTGSYPLEIAMWPGRVFGYHKIVGYIRSLDKTCVREVIVDNDSEQHMIGIGSQSLQFGTDNCDAQNKIENLLSAYGFVKLAGGGNTFRIYYSMRASTDASQPSPCLEALAQEGCYALAVFNRDKVSEAMQEIIAKSPSTMFSGPDSSVVAVLSSGESAPNTMQKDFLANAQQNVAITQQYLEADRRNLELRHKKNTENKPPINNEPDKSSREAKEYQKYLARPPKQYDGPFNDLSGGQYLNAIYLEDFEEAIRQDKQFGYKLKEPAKTQAILLGALAKIVPYRQISDAADAMEHIEDHVTLGVPVIVTYMRNYKTTSERCLTDGAVEFTITTTTDDRVMKDELGNEMWRVPGNSYDTMYSVNKEFADAFRAHGTQDPATAGSMIGDAMYTDGKQTQIVRGVRQMMDKFPCDSPVIKQMEKRMLEFLDFRNNRSLNN